MSTQAARAQKLKEEGNVLFQLKEYMKAYEKYTAAIDEDGQNAILYSNRAACCLAVGKYLDASGDAKKATELDPSYYKGWARLASAAQEMGSLKQAMKCWSRAIQALETDNDPSPKLLQQKETYEANLRAVEQRFGNEDNRMAHLVTEDHMAKIRMPWDRANLLLVAMMANNVIHSSAYVIASAAKSFQGAWRKVESIKLVQSPDGRMKGAVGCSNDNVVARVVDGILRDRRVFNASGGDEMEWIELMYAQIRFEDAEVKGWVELGPEAAFAEAQKRLQLNGWADVRPAISLTIRAWTLRAFITYGIDRNWGVAIEWFKNVIELIERGRKVWRNVAKKDRGEVFDNGFFLAVRGLYMEAYFQACVKDQTLGEQSSYSISTLLEIAEELYKDSKKWKPNPKDYRTPEDIGAMYGFFVYPRAEALGIQGFCYKHMATAETNDLGKCVALANLSAEFYREGAETYPEDEERRAFFYSMCMHVYWASGAVTIDYILPFCAKFRECVPRMRSIWQYSSLQMQGNRELFDMILDYETDMRNLLTKGKVEGTDLTRPGFIPLFPLPKKLVTSVKTFPNLTGPERQKNKKKKK